MSISLNRQLRRSLSLAVVGTLAVGLTACTGRGGGQLPPAAGFTGPASFGFSFSCEDKGGLNPPTGRLHIELSYTDHGSKPLPRLDVLDSRDRRQDRSGDWSPRSAAVSNRRRGGTS